MAGKQRLIVEEQAKQQAALDEIAARQKRRNDQEELYLRYLENEERILARQGADDPRMRWLMSGQAALPPITGPYSGASQGFTPGAPFRPDPGVPHGPWWPGPLQVPQDFGPGPFAEDAGEALERFREEERARLDAISQEIAEPFHQAFARAVVDGFREGFDNLKDIGEALLADWLGMFAQGISRQVFQPIFNNLVGAVAGGGGSGSTLQVLPVALPAEVVNAGIGVSSSLQGTIHAIGSEVRTLEEFRRS
jgi:hypothetical protein